MNSGARSRESNRNESAVRDSIAGGAASTWEPEPTITIDGKIASEAQLAALDERDIASIAVYKGKEALCR